MRVRYIPSGDVDLIKDFLRRGFPVMMPTWHIDGDGSQMGHYRLIHGFDDSNARFDIRDSLEPAGYAMDYAAFDALWRVFNRRMLVVFPPHRSEDVEEIAGPLGSETHILERSLEIASRETVPPRPLPPGMSEGQYRAYADFNRAMALTALGRDEEAAAFVRSAFERGLPWRMLWYQPEVLAAMFAVGEHAWIISRTSAALAPYPYLEELWYWQGRAELESGRPGRAAEAFRRAVEIRPDWDAAMDELARLE